MPLHKLLSESLSDEAAFYLVEFLVQLTSTLESHYFVQMRRHAEEMERQSLRLEQGYDAVGREDENPLF